MVAYTLVQRLTPNLALMTSAALAIAVALGIALVPGGYLEDAVLVSGIAAFVPAAEPPLGVTARLTLAVCAGGGIGLFAWFALSVLMALTPSSAATKGERRPVVRRADAHPDAPPREPLRAGRDLGFDLRGTEAEALASEPLDLAEPILPPEPAIAMGSSVPDPLPNSLAIPVAVTPPPVSVATALPPVQSLPQDLDLPLAAFDPDALLSAPLPPPQPLAPLLRRKPARPFAFDAGERFETFELTPAVRPTGLTPPPAPVEPPIAAPETTASVHALLDRLERGIVRRATSVEPEPPAPEPHGLEDTLSALRRMAVRG